MIELNRLNGAGVLVNPDLIRTVEATPDTVLTFTNGETLPVKNSTDEVVRKIIDFRKKCALPLEIKE